MFPFLAASTVLTSCSDRALQIQAQEARH